MVYVFFIYGLAFFALGHAVAVYPKKGSAFWFAGRLRYVAAFGLLHGLNEWVDMFIFLGDGDMVLYLRVVRTVLLGLSFFFLLQFGILGLMGRKKHDGFIVFIPYVLVAVWLGVIASSPTGRFVMSDIWGRYLLGAPGIGLSAYVFLRQAAALRKEGLMGHELYLRITAVAFIVYAAASGLIVPRADFFPASTFNYDNFMRVAGFPVQGLRAACAVVAAYCMFRVLEIFNWESRSALIKARDNLERGVEERTMELRAANEDLETEISERTRAEAFIRDILQSVDEAFVVIAPDFRIISANRAYCRQTKWAHDDIVGRHCYEVSHRLDRPCYMAGEDCAVRHTFETGEPYVALHTHHDINGEPVYVETKAFPMRDSSGKVIQVIETINDITEKRRLEAQLRHSQKLEAIGTLTGGIAHDFNNILTTIMGYGEFLQEEIARDDPLRAYVDMILSASERAANLTQSMLAFSRKQVSDPRLFNINEVLDGVRGMLARVIGEDIMLEFASHDEELVVKVDKGQMEQVLMNLASNARDAMPEGGTLSITISEVELDHAFVAVHGYGRPGRYALVSVSDTGTGMDERTREQAFEPFFTTKDVGRGTGLGLAMVYGIIRQHEGYINLYSEPGRGSTFKIYLPTVKATPEVSEEDHVGAVEGGTETILVAEDNEGIRDLVTVALKRAGYTVIIADDGEEALQTFRQRRDEVDMMLLDVIMPKLDGRQVFEEVRKIEPGMKILFMSGYSEDIITKKGILSEGMDFILKPISPRGLLKRVREILDR